MSVQQHFSICSSFLHCTRTYITRAGRSRLLKIPKKSSSNIIEIRCKGEFLYGVSPCLAALQANRRRIYKIYVKPGVSEKKGAMKRSALDNVWKFAEKRKVDVLRLDKNSLETLSGKKPHQGVLMDVAPLSFKKMESSDCKLSPALRSENPVWLLLDEIHDPMNLGAILRCAFFLGVDKVITTAKKCCPLSPAVSKASSGAMELSPVYSVNNVGEFLSEAGNTGWKILGTCGSTLDEDSASNVPVLQCSQHIVKDPTIIALGNEGYGLRDCIVKACSAMITVSPHRHLPEGFDSLNVGVAAGILLHAIQQNKNH